MSEITCYYCFGLGGYHDPSCKYVKEADDEK